jgi:hypothetical protein
MAETPIPGARRARRPIPSWYYLAGAAGLGLAFILYRQRKAKAVAAAAAAGAAAPQPTSAAGGSASYSDLANLQAQIADLYQTQASTTQASGVAGPVVTDVSTIPSLDASHVGAGVPKGAGSVTTTAGTFSPISPTAAQEYLKSGGSLFWQPVAGVFTNASQGKNYLLSQPTQLFVKAG